MAYYVTTSLGVSVSSELLGFCFRFSLIFRFCAVREIKLPILSASEHMVIYRIASYHIFGNLSIRISQSNMDNQTTVG